jgi:N-succinyldiaminopimelate aminotransferase
MNPDLERLQAYPFERLAALLRDVEPRDPSAVLNLSIGEPRHQPPAFVAEQVIAHLHGLAQYPTTRGGAGLREAIAGWLCRRYGLAPAALDPARNILPVNGTREALFAFAQCAIDRGRQPLVLMPNPFYQIYEGAALLAGAEPGFVPTTAEGRWLPEFDSVGRAQWDRCQLLYICSPGNPTGAVMDLGLLQRLIDLAERHDFVIASDECYSELYDDESAPPAGLLQAAAALGNTDFRRCLVFHSLSKRSSLPGLRSGFVAGDAALIDAFFRYRTYHGCSMPLHTQAASAAAWSDEAHVVENRALYRAKFDAVLGVLEGVLDADRPAGSFYLWPRTPIEDSRFARELYAREAVRVLPGSFLSRRVGGRDPGSGHVRIALVASLEACVEAAQRIRRLCEGF